MKQIIENLKSWWKLGTGLGTVYAVGLIGLFFVNVGLLASLSLPMVPKEFINTSSLPLFLLYTVALVIFTGIMWAVSGILAMVLDPVAKNFVKMLVPAQGQYAVRVWLPSMAMALVPTIISGTFNIVSFLMVQVVMLVVLFFALFVLKVIKHPTPRLSG